MRGRSEQAGITAGTRQGKQKRCGAGVEGKSGRQGAQRNRRETLRKTARN